MAGNPLDLVTAPSVPSMPAAKGAAPANPLDLLSSAGGPAASSANSQVQSVGQSNAKLLDTISLAGNQRASQQAASIANTNPGGGWFSDILKAIDLPRAAVVSAIHTVANPVQGSPGDVAREWLNGTENHMTFGHVLNNDLGVHNHLVDSIGGMAGDVAFDPLTYVGGLGEAAKAMGVVSKVADAVNASSKAADAAAAVDKVAQGVQAGTHTAEDLNAARAASEGATKEAEAKSGGGVLNGDTMARLQTKGVAGLNADERQALSGLIGKGDIKTGLGVRVPGSKLAGSPKSLTLIPGAVTDPITGAVKGLASKVADTKAVSRLEQALVPHAAIKSAMRGAALSGDGEKVAGLKSVLDLLPTSVGVARQTLNGYGPRFADALNQIPDEAMPHVAAAMEGSPEAAQAIADAGGAGGLSDLQNAYKEIHAAATAKGMKLGTIENYFPHQLTEEARQIFKAHGNSVRAGRQFESAVQRQFTPGTEYLGHEITDPREGGPSIIDQMNAATRAVYGQDAWDLFKSDPRDVTANYLRGIAHSMGQQHFLNELEQRGLTASGDMARTPEEWQALGSPDVQAPGYIKEALAKLADEQSHGVKGGKFLHYYDKALNSWKAYSLAMPGKAMRHTLAGPLWGSYLGNVGPTSLREGFGAWRSYQKALKASGGDVEAALKSVPKQHAAQIRQAVEHGLFHGHQFDMADIKGPKNPRLAAVQKVNPVHRYMQANQELQREGQDYWRYAMFHDASKKGMSPEEAAAKTRSMLGDPHNITNAERATLRRVVPFYTFLRQNAPVELHAMLTQPGKFVNAIDSPEQETSQWSPQQGIVPEMFSQTGAVPLPWKIGGNEVYASPDLPFSRFDQMLSGKNQVLSQTAPEIQAAIEYLTNTNTFTNTPFSPYGKQMPAADLPAVLGPILSRIAPNSVYKTQQPSTDYGVTTPAGQWQITPEASTILGNFLPILSQAQGLYTAGSPNKATRGDTSLIDALEGGLTFRTNDPSQQTGELLRRQALLKQIAVNLQNRGELPAYIRTSKNLGG